MVQNILLHADSILILLLDNKSVKILHKNNIHLYERKFITVGWDFEFYEYVLETQHSKFYCEFDTLF